jgi:hypothetical protein
LPAPPGCATKYGQRTSGFAAHLALYPQCWRIRTAQAGKDPLPRTATVRRRCRGTVHILTGDRDGYDGPDGCKLFVEWLAGGDAGKLYGHDLRRRDVRLGQ